jgi:transcriptional regulator with XRE-family HTH domain
MKERQLSAPDVARQSGFEITPSYVNLVAKGKAENITVNKLGSLAKGLQDDPYNLFRIALGEPALGPQDPWPSYLLDQAIGRIVGDAELSDAFKLLLKLDPKQIRAAKTALDSLGPVGRRAKR